MALPNPGAFDVPVDPNDFTASDAAAAHNAVLEAIRQLPGAAAVTELTINAGLITPTRAWHIVDTEGDAAEDDLIRISINQVPDGHLLILKPVSATRVVTVKQTSGVGRIQLAGGFDFVMDGLHKSIILQRQGERWIELLRVQYLPTGEAHGRQVFTTSGDFVCPSDNVWVTMIGGGGGGGGGAGTNGDTPNTGDDGDTGGYGGASSFGGYASAPGGTGGGGGNKLGPGGGASPGRNLPGGRAIEATGWVRGGLGAYPLSSPLPPHGTGGKGGNGALSASAGGGGASGYFGGHVFRHPVNNLKIGQTIPVVVGAGGAGGLGGEGSAADGQDGEAGADGVVIVEW